MQPDAIGSNNLLTLHLLFEGCCGADPVLPIGTAIETSQAFSDWIRFRECPRLKDYGRYAPVEGKALILR